MNEPYELIPGVPLQIFPTDQLVSTLGKLIEAKAADLHRYKNRPEAKQHFIDKESVWLNQLIGIHNSLCPLRFLPSWIQAEAVMHQLEQRDSQLRGFHMCLETNHGGSTYGMIEMSHRNETRFR